MHEWMDARMDDKHMAGASGCTKGNSVGKLFVNTL